MSDASSNRATIVIYLTPSSADVPGLDDSLRSVAALTPVSVETHDEPAVFGPLAGKALTIILSDPVQAAKSAAEIGVLLWAAVRLIKGAGKCLHVGGGAARLLGIGAAAEECLRHRRTPIDDAARVWGPVPASSPRGVASDCFDGADGASWPVCYLMAVAVPDDGRWRTVNWYLMSASGGICATWETNYAGADAESPLPARLVAGEGE